jgi:poly(A) polymerase
MRAMTESSDFHLAPLPAWASMEASVLLMACLGPQARFVGGCVRDALTGQAPSDLDLATLDAPETVMAKLAAAGFKAIPTGIAHGTVTAVVRGRTYEITTLRRDIETDGRHATVEFTDDWAADAARRDFTLNAMSMDAAGRVFDYFGGRADVAERRVRFVGDAATRVAEDYLRALRFFRFQARFGGDVPDAQALAACQQAAAQLKNLSAERVRGELFRLLEGPNAPAMLRLMQRLQMFDFWLPELGDPVALERLQAVAAKVGARVDAVLALAALVSAASAAAVAKRLRCSNADAARLVALTAPSAALDPAFDDRQRRAAFYRLGGDPAPFVLLAWSKSPGFDSMFAHAAAWVRPKFRLNGDDARAAGIAPGPAMGAWLKAREEEWIAAGCPV